MNNSLFSRKVFGEVILSALTPLLFVVFFWQTRLALFNKFEVYDYLIPFVYLSDVLIVMLILAQTIASPSWLIKNSIIKRRALLLGVVLFLLSNVMVLTSGNVLHNTPFVYKFVKVVEMFCFAVWIGHITPWYKERRIIAIISAGLIPLVFLGFIQFMSGHSLGLKMIGEWDFTKYLPGVSVVNLLNVTTLRPYATFPHPNVFGAVMLLFSLYWFVRFLEGSRAMSTKNIELLLFIVFTFATALSFSRSAWVAFFVAVIYILKSTGKTSLSVRKPLYTIIAVIVGFVVAYRFSQLFFEDALSFLRRRELAFAAIRMWLDNIWYGVGLNQFLIRLDAYWLRSGLERFSQPAHNIFLLFLAETGLVGTMGILLSLWSTIVGTWSRLPLWLRSWWIAILITSMFDHYWVTLQSGMLLFFLTLGFTFVRMKVPYGKLGYEAQE